MSAAQIMDALNGLSSQGPASDDAARAGFLEWVFALPDGMDPVQAAKGELAHLHAGHGASAAALLFLDYLTQASHAQTRARRRGGRKRVVH